MGIVRYVRDVPPAHYLLKINSFSKLQQTQVEFYQSKDFEASGYKWRLILYPNGNTKGKGAGHISLFLEIADIDNLPPNWRANVYLKMFIQDLKQNKYLTIDDDAQERKTWTYDKMTPRWGYDQLISQVDLKNASKGYLAKDTCVFGVEVFVDQYTGNGESFTINNVDTQRNSYTWHIPNFSAQDDTRLWSPQFSIGGRLWKLNIDPKGFGSGKGKTLCVSLSLDDATTLPVGRKVYVKHEIAVKNQLAINDEVKNGVNWLSAADHDHQFGWITFMPLVAVNNASKGFLVRDTLTVEVKILALSIIQDFN